ncbi:MAG: hypothetical protein QGG14_10240 [Planctomycetota bacterium]|jgi:hypothetical protein|nr:hypothetical protein [Planctomycetota bacterium]
MPTRFVRLSASLCLLALLQGCCGVLVGVFGCGAGSPLVRVNWDSPTRSLRTLRAAIRHGDARVIYECFSEEFKRQHGVDGLAFAVAWEQMQAKVPGIVLAGEAEIIEKSAPTARTREYLMDAHGHRFRVVLVARDYWETGRQRQRNKDEVIVEGHYVSPDTSVLKHDALTGTVTTVIKTFELVGLERQDIAFVRAGTEWKVRSLQPLQEKQ